jgi:ribosomal protein L23
MKIVDYERQNELKVQIDKIVYELYGVTPKEIDVIEGKTDAESFYLRFMTTFKSFKFSDEKEKFVASKTEDELNLVVKGLSAYVEDHTLSDGEKSDIKELKKLIKE